MVHQVVKDKNKQKKRTKIIKNFKKIIILFKKSVNLKRI